MDTYPAGSTSGHRRSRRRERRKRRHRSPSYSSSESNFTSSEDRANWKRHEDVGGMSVFNHLCQQVQVLTEFMNASLQEPAGEQTESGPELTSSQQPAPEEQCTQVQNNCDDFSFQSLETTLKDTGVGKTNEERFNLINSLQLFGSPDWMNINFIDTQKSYLSKPGFIELETNDDLKPFDKNKFLPSCERTLSALANAILLQRSILQDNVSSLLSWVKDLHTVSYEEFCTKTKELFSDNKEYNKISNDIMQIICGKRASIINNRRTELLKSIPNNYTVDKFKKIPPSSEFLFESDSFTNLLQKEGGPAKVFVKSQTLRKNLSTPKNNLKFPFKTQFAQPFRSTPEASGNSKPREPYRTKRKVEPKKSERRHGSDPKRRRYD